MSRRESRLWISELMCARPFIETQLRAAAQEAGGSTPRAFFGSGEPSADAPELR